MGRQSTDPLLPSQPGSLGIATLVFKAPSSFSMRLSYAIQQRPFEVVSHVSALAARPGCACADCEGLFKPTAIWTEEDTLS